METKLSKLFVGGLSWHTTDSTLQQYFCQFGKIKKCIVMKDTTTGKSRGFGFVTFTDRHSADTALNYDGQSEYNNIDSRRVEVKRSDPKACPKARVGTNMPRIFVGGLPADLTETELRDYFESFGNVTDAVIIVKDDQRRTGFGFVSFNDMDSVNRLVSLHFVRIKGKYVEIKSAEPRDSDKNLLYPFIEERKPKCDPSDKDFLLFSDNDIESGDDDSDNESVVTVIRKF